GVGADLFKHARKRVVARATLGACAQMPAFRGEHVGLHQLVIVQMAAQISLGLRLHVTVPPSPFAASESRGTNGLLPWTRSNRSFRPRHESSDRHSDKAERPAAGGPAAVGRRRR